MLGKTFVSLVISLGGSAEVIDVSKISRVQKWR